MNKKNEIRGRIVLLQEERFSLAEDGNRSADGFQDYFEYTSSGSSSDPERVAGQQRTGLPNRTGKKSIARWLAIAFGAGMAAALIMKPKKAY